jgi:hypothetical protein
MTKLFAPVRRILALRPPPLVALLADHLVGSRSTSVRLRCLHVLKNGGKARIGCGVVRPGQLLRTGQHSGKRNQPQPYK